MKLFRGIVLTAVLAGALAGTVMTGAHHLWTVPLILEAEVYEDQAPAPAHEHSATVGQAHAAVAEPAHEHSHEGWKPEDGFSRTAFTWLADVLAAIGFGVLLVTASEAFGGIRSRRHGLLWGASGGLIFIVAPLSGLPPELPGMPAAALEPRQLWWLATAACTAAGLGLLAFKPRPLKSVIAVLLLVVPHFIWVPQAGSHETAIPLQLLRDFQVGSVVIGVAFWLLLGVLVAQFRGLFVSPDVSRR